MTHVYIFSVEKVIGGRRRGPLNPEDSYWRQQARTIVAWAAPIISGLHLVDKTWQVVVLQCVENWRTVVFLSLTIGGRYQVSWEFDLIIWKLQVQYCFQEPDTLPCPDSRFSVVDIKIYTLWFGVMEPFWILVAKFHVSQKLCFVHNVHFSSILGDWGSVNWDK